MADTLGKGWGEWAVLEAHFPGEPAIALGVVLRDDCDQLHVKLSSRWWQSYAEADSDIWELLAADLQEKARQYRASELLAWLAQGSHAIRLSAVRKHGILDAERDLNALYDKFIKNKFDSGRTLPCPVGSSGGRKRQFVSTLLGIMRPSVHWAATAALAIVVLCFTATDGERGNQQSPSPLYPLLSAGIFGRFPGVLHESAVPHSGFFTDLEIQPPSPPLVKARAAVRRRKITKPNKFLPPRLQPLVRSRQVVKELHPPPIAVDPQSANLPLVAFEPSLAPAYVPRRNRFLRSLAFLGTPFKLLRGRRKPA